METPLRHTIENHAGEACVERNRGALFSDKELPLLAMREVFLCHPDSASKRQYAFNRQNRSVNRVSAYPEGWPQESQRTPETSVWEEDTVLRKRHPNVHYLPPALEN